MHDKLATHGVNCHLCLNSSGIVELVCTNGKVIHCVVVYKLGSNSSSLVFNALNLVGMKNRKTIIK